MSDNNPGAEHGALPPSDSGGQTTPTRVPTVLGIDRNPLQLAHVIGGQYIITSQAQNVPPLTQITSTQQSTTPVTRIIGISSIRSSSSLSLPSTISSQSIVNALTKPRPSTARTQLFPSDNSNDSSSIGQQRTPTSTTNVRKRSRADELPPGCENLTGNRARAMEHKWARSKCIKESYYEHIAELYFLETSGNMLDYYTWRKKPRTNHYVNYLTKHQLDASDLSQEDTPLQSPVTTSSNISRLASPKPETSATNISTTQSVVLATPITQTGLLSPKLEGTRFLLIKPTLNMNAKNIAFVTTSNTQPTATSKETATVTKMETPTLTPIQATNPSIAVTTTVYTPVSSSIVTSNTSNPNTKTSTAQSSSTSSTSSSVNCHSSSVKKSAVSITAGGNQEQIVEKAKQEAYVMQRISELQKEGLWSERRLPKVQETQRNKSHWDYLLEEMVWLAADFAQERKWKKAAAKKCAKMVQKYFQDKALAAQKAEKAQELQLRRIASFIAKEIKTFWSNVEKIVEFKQQTILEEKRKKALDQQLSFIVDQTEKYSQLLAKDMNKSQNIDSQNQSISKNSSRVPSPHDDDDEFRPDDNSSDDEETIAQAEAADAKEEQSKEVEALQRESEMNLEDLNLKDYLENRDKIKLSDSEDEDDEKSSTRTSSTDSKKKSKDNEFTIDSDAESEDIEDTIKEQEEKEGKIDHQKEIDELQAENEMSIEELMKKYSAPLPQDDTDKMSIVSEEKSSESEESAEETSESTDNEDSSENEANSSDEDENLSEDEEKIGLKSLLEDSTDKNKENEDGENLINDVAAIAESIQPKGNTLSSTNVVTPVPFLLKHNLREYQHIGLDWLVTMFERKLNGILADEMGLGKTIQTIALLAHLACVKGDWGPHLIIVPTSVMLNWEMELKKWCPGFKILTYYGTQKERKLKRTGWTKPNAFHICITSYKLVIQDHQSFRRKKWKYLILDEAQNIKNFKSQRWQLLLNFQTQQRLLLTGTPLQNNLMELWSLMHFLMPNVFQSHREFREWFSNPVTGMIEGNSEYNESIIKRLHKVLRPFLLRRLKSEVEKQMPKKFEHVVMCRLSKRQRFLYEDYMSRAKTKETLASGNLLSVINVLMQLRKVCNHPNLFEIRPTISPFQMEGIIYDIPSLVYKLFDHQFFEKVDLNTLHFQLMNLEYNLTAYGAYRTCKYRAPTTLIELIDTQPDPPPKCPKGLVRMKVKLGEPLNSRTNSPNVGIIPQKPNTPEKIQQVPTQVKVATSPSLKFRVTGPAGQTLQGYSVQLVQHQGSVKAIPVALSAGQQAAVSTASLAIKPVGTAIKTEQRVSVGSFAQLVQTPMGKHILLTQSAALPSASTVAIAGTTAVMTSSGQRLTVLSKPVTATTGTLATSPQKMLINSSPIINSSPQNQNPTQPNTELTSNSVDPNTTSPSISRPLTATLIKQLREQAPSQNKLQPVSESTKIEENIVEDKPNPQKQAYLDRVQQVRNRKLNIIVRMNEWRCQASPMYGGDLRDTLTINERCTKYNPYTGAYLTLDQAMHRIKPWEYGNFLQECTKQPGDYVNQLKDIIERYVFCVPAVSAPQPTYRVLNPPQDVYWREQRDMFTLQRELSPKAALLHPIASAMITQFPDPRLIQYDCGKLQTLDRLLRKLKIGGHRVLIFTQMTRMLDILEAFLNFHGHIYLRLDGTTKVDQRQVLMERFNGDKRIFAFILSTRSGGVGVNLTGADTVIFYDSDWNPTMDAQAQDRCHRIGQTRDVHIYRLVSEKTIEENILKKANQKRMLGDLAIEGGNFTTAYFKSSTIQDLFNIDATLEDASQRMDISQSKPTESTSTQTQTQSNGDERQALGALESALAACEDDQDVQAARTAKAEAVADLAEFDESIPLEDANPTEKEEMSKAEVEVQNLIKQLTPVERYAMRFVEETEAAWSAEQLAAAEREIEAQKREWEEKRLAEIRREEERRKACLEEESEILTFSREDSTNQVRNSNLKNKRYSKFNKSNPKRQNQNSNNENMRHTRNRTLSEKLESPETKNINVSRKNRLKSTDTLSEPKKTVETSRKTRKSLPQPLDNDLGASKTRKSTSQALDNDLGASKTRKSTSQALDNDLGASKTRKSTCQALDNDLGASKTRKSISQALDNDLGISKPRKSTSQTLENHLGSPKNLESASENSKVPKTQGRKGRKISTSSTPKSKYVLDKEIKQELIDEGSMDLDESLNDPISSENDPKISNDSKNSENDPKISEKGPKISNDPKIGNDPKVRDKDLKIRDKDSKIRDQHTKIRDQDSKIRDQNPKIRDKDPKIRDKDSKIRDQDSKFSNDPKISKDPKFIKDPNIGNDPHVSNMDPKISGKGLKFGENDLKVSPDSDIVDIEKDFDEILEKTVIKKFSTPEKLVKNSNLTPKSNEKCQNIENLSHNVLNNHVDSDDVSSTDSDDLPLKSLTKLTVNKVDESSPRTRSRGTVKINLWTLDVSPILPGVKPVRNPPHQTPKKSNFKKVDNGNTHKIKNDIITVHSESPIDSKLIENCIKNEVSVLVTDITDSPLDNTESTLNKSEASENNISNPKIESGSLVKKSVNPKKKGLKKTVQKQTLDQWLKPNLKRKNLDDSSEKPVPMKLAKNDSNLETQLSKAPINDSDLERSRLDDSSMTISFDEMSNLTRGDLQELKEQTEVSKIGSDGSKVRSGSQSQLGSNEAKIGPGSGSEMVKVGSGDSEVEIGSVFKIGSEGSKVRSGSQSQLGSDEAKIVPGSSEMAKVGSGVSEVGYVSKIGSEGSKVRSGSQSQLGCDEAKVGPGSGSEMVKVGSGGSEIESEVGSISKIGSEGSNVRSGSQSQLGSDEAKFGSSDIAKVGSGESKIESDSEVGSMSKIGSEESKMRSNESKSGSEEAKVGSETKIGYEVAKMGSEESKVGSEESKVGSEVPKIGSEESKVGSEESKVGSEVPKIESEDSKVGSEVPKIGSEESRVGSKESNGSKSKIKSDGSKIEPEDCKKRSELAKSGSDQSKIGSERSKVESKSKNQSPEIEIGSGESKIDSDCKVGSEVSKDGTETKICSKVPTMGFEPKIGSGKSAHCETDSTLEIASDDSKIESEESKFEPRLIGSNHSNSSKTTSRSPKKIKLARNYSRPHKPENKDTPNCNLSSPNPKIPSENELPLKNSKEEAEESGAMVANSDSKLLDEVPERNLIVQVEKLDDSVLAREISKNCNDSDETAAASKIDIFDAALICELENSSSVTTKKRSESDSESNKKPKRISRTSLSDSETKTSSETRRSRRISSNFDKNLPLDIPKSVVKLTRIDEIINEECPIKKSRQITRLVNYTDSESENSTDSNPFFNAKKLTSTATNPNPISDSDRDKTKNNKSSSDSDSDLESLQKIREKLNDLDKRNTRRTSSSRSSKMDTDTSVT